MWCVLVAYTFILHLFVGVFFLYFCYCLWFVPYVVYDPSLYIFVVHWPLLERGPRVVPFLFIFCTYTLPPPRMQFATELCILTALRLTPFVIIILVEWYLCIM